MPQIIYPTPTVINSGPVGPNSAVLRGRVYTVKAPAVTPLDETTQAAAYRAANKDKTRSVNVWMDVQYGQAPVGALRFKDAVPYAYPAGTHDVSGTPNVSWQNDYYTMGDDGRPDLGLTNAGTANWVKHGAQLSEDSLTCKITAPVGASGVASLFFIHGGKWVYGWSNDDRSRTELYSADHGQAVCNVAYRLGTFGHNAHPDLVGTEPSQAVSDLKTSLQWWFNNCASFGCDPARITIMGTSAGGAAVQIFASIEEAQAWYARAWVDSGGGTGRYLDTADYALDFKLRETAFIGLAPALQAMPSSSFATVGQALAANGYAWAMQHAATPTQIAAQGDGRVVLNSDAIRKAVNGETLGMADTRWIQGDKDYPFKRDAYNTALEAAKAGKFRKPTVFSWAAYEIWDLLGSDYLTAMWTLLDMSQGALDYYAGVLGYASYADFLGASWQPVGGLKTKSGAQFSADGVTDIDLGIDYGALPAVTSAIIYNVPEAVTLSMGTIIATTTLSTFNPSSGTYITETINTWELTGSDFSALQGTCTVGHVSYPTMPVSVYRAGLLAEGVVAYAEFLNTGDAESRAVLYTEAVFGFSARRAAQAMAETASATSWAFCNNFSANSIWPRHSQLIANMLGMLSWVVGGVQSFPDADPPGNYANNRMDGIFMYVMLSKILANFVETGDPNGVYSYAGGFDLLDGGAIAPADGGSMTATIAPFDLAHPDWVTVIGKWYDPWTMNAGDFPPGSTSIVEGLDRQAMVRVRTASWRGDLYADAVARGA